MKIPDIIDWFVTVSNLIDDKLKTPSGKLSLVIINCLILGGSTVHSCNSSSALEKIIKEKEDILKEKEKQTNKADSLQNTINTYIATEDERCNETLEKGALLQQKMQIIYNQKEQENYRIAEENRRILKEREATAKAKIENIKVLTNLKNE